MISDYFTLAFKNLKHRGLRSWLTILGVIIGIAAVVSLISLGAGLKEAVTGQFSSLSPDVLTIQNSGTGLGPPGATTVVKLNDHDVKVIESTQGVKLTIPRLIRVIKLEYNDAAQFSYATNVPEDSKKVALMFQNLNVELESGRFLKPGEKGKVVLGSDLVKEDVFGKTISVGRSVKIQGETYEVVGILKKGSSFTINQVVFMSEKDMKQSLNIIDEWDMIIAQVNNQDNIEEIGKSIEDKLRKDRGEKIGEEDFSVQTPVKSLESINTILTIVNIIIAGIASISLIVGGIGIANIMYASVVERTKEIGVMKAIGAKNKDILGVFLVESGLLGLVGGVIGALLGLSLALGISALAGNFLGGLQLKVSVDYVLLLGAIAFSFTIGIICGLLPSLQASKLKVVDAFRK
ncbi:MacB-like periplasmic core domain protein [uncultured archaeon]|nr:MacB-like periplasmic core domain protein [uncultured archaeon]